MNGITTHYLSKEEVSQKLQGVSYSFQESYWDSFLESQGNTKLVSPKATPLKISPKLLAIPVSIILVTAIIYFSVTNLKSQNSSKEPSKHAKEATMVTEPKTETNTVVAKTPPVVKKEVVAPQPKPVAITTEAAKTIPASPSGGKKEETPAVTNQNAKALNEEKNKVTEQAVVAPEEKKEPVVTKKKKRRNREKTGSPVLIPNPEEDNVVIPEN